MIRPVWNYIDSLTTDDGLAPSFLARSTRMQLRRLVNAHREGWPLENHVERVGRMAAEDAHRGGATSTELLVTLRDTWRCIDDVQALPSQQARDLLRLVITACVHAYVAEPAGAPAMRRPVVVRDP